jgi:hypothetical protein
MYEGKYKYPRTPHMPWSPGATSDDKRLADMAHFVGKLVVGTEKMDGENTTLYNNYYHARSLDSKNHPSRNWVKGLWGSIRHNIPDGWRICGENMYAQHSITYENLESYFYVFSIWDENNNCLAWDETVAYAEMLGLKTVPVVFTGYYDEKVVMEYTDGIDLNMSEGIVLRMADGFCYDDFDKNVAKWVREGHVQTSEHWMLKPVVPNKLSGETKKSPDVF